MPNDLIEAHAGKDYSGASLSGFSTGNWRQAIARFTGSASRSAGIDGTMGSNNLDAHSPTSIDVISVGATKQLTGRNPFDGRLSLVFVHTAAAAGGVTDAWIAYEKEMLDQPSQSDFYGVWTWKGRAVNALDLGFQAEDPAAADENAALLSEACKGRRLIIWPAGDFYFNKITGITSTTSSFDQIAWKGAASEYAWQHQEEGGQGDKQLTRFIIIGMDADDVWLDLSARLATRIGPWRIEDITFRIPVIGEGESATIHEGSLFRIGNTADPNPVGESIRGLSVKGCYFTFEGQISGSYLINPTESGTTPDSGWYVNRPHGRNFAWQVSKGYDIAFEDCSFRGWYVGGEFRQNDRFLARNWRGGANGRVIDVHGIPGANAPVPAAIFGLWSEGHWVVGANLESCEVHGLNAESGYKSSYAPIIGDQDYNNDNSPLGSDSDPYDDDPRRLLQSITWSINSGTDSVTFPYSNLPYTRKLSDYFEPRTVVRFESSGQPPRYLYIESIDDAEPDMSPVQAVLHFRNAATTSYIHSGMSGNGENITRFFGTGVNLVGDKTAVFGHNVHANVILGDFNHTDPEVAEGAGDFPLGFIVPGAMPTVVSGGVAGLTKNTSDPTTRWAVVADDYGTQFKVRGGVRWIGAEAPDHPLALKDGEPQLEFDPNIRSMEITRVSVPGDADGDNTVEPREFVAKIRHRVFPGRGITVADNVARNLRFRRREDTDLGGRLVMVHDLGDSSVGWRIPGLSRPGKAVDYVIRFFAQNASQSLNELTVYGGEGSVVQTYHPQFWNTVSGRLEENQLDDDSGEIFIWGDNIEVAWVELWQDE